MARLGSCVGVVTIGETLNGIVDVLSCCIFNVKVLTTMLPAFLLAGAVTAFVPAATMLRYLGPQAPRFASYAAAAGAGVVLALCSCNVVPLFVGIYRRGAGIGPAFTFLFAGPAINVVSAVYVIQVVGLGAGVWRIVSVPVIAVIVGLLMSFFFRRAEQARQDGLATRDALSADGAGPAVWLLLGLLLAMVAFGSSNVLPIHHAIGMVLLAAIAAVVFLRSFARADFIEWMRETWGLVKLVIPVLVPALLLIAFAASHISIVWIDRWLSADLSDAPAMLRVTFMADVFGMLMYFPILSEVAFTKAFLQNGMSIGPGMAILLTGAGLSLPGAIILAREIGWQRVAVYIGLIALFTTASAVLFVSQVGQYICACMNM